MLPRTSGLEIFRKMRAGEMVQAGSGSLWSGRDRCAMCYMMLHVLKGSAVLRAKIDMSSPNVIMLKSQSF